MVRQHACKRAYRFRFYPTPEQEQLLRRTVGCCRKAYNLALEARQMWITFTMPRDRKTETILTVDGRLTSDKISLIPFGTFSCPRQKLIAVH